MNTVADSTTWLAQHQRDKCDGSSPLTTFQDLLVDEIIAPQSAAESDDPNALVRAVAAYSATLMHEVQLLPGEFAQEALWSVHASDYLEQVKEGGHAQYFANRSDDEIAVRCAGFGLKSMVADPHFQLFALYGRLMRANPQTAKKLAVNAGFRDARTALRDIDKRFAAVEESEPLTTRHKRWLKSLRKLKIVPDNELRDNFARIVALNPLRGKRREEAEKQRVRREASDPMYRSVRELCDMAGLAVVGMSRGGIGSMRATWPEGPDLKGYAVNVATDKGARTALFYAEGGMFKRYLAVLIEPGNALPAGSVSLSREDFTAIVPAAPRK